MPYVAVIVSFFAALGAATSGAGYSVGAGEVNGAITPGELAQFAEAEGISLDEAQRAADHSAPLYDFVVRHRSDPSFINVAATYDGRYAVQVIATEDEAAKRFADELGSALEMEITATTSGNGVGRAHALDVVNQLDEAGLAFGYDANDGTFTVYTEGRSDATDLARQAVGAEVADKLAFAVHVPDPEGVEDATYAGDVIWASTNGAWSQPASVGATWRGTPSGGGGDHIAFVSAAHLRNPSSSTWFWAGAYPNRGDPSAQANPKLLLEVCNGSNVSQRGDYQVVRMDASTNQPETDVNGVPFYQAGGYYIGQLARVHGQHTNVTGSVRLHGIYSMPSTFQCTGSRWTIATTAKGTTGDSGGSMHLYYNGSWYLAGIYAGRVELDATNPGTEGVSSPVWYFNQAAGYTNQRLCTLSNPCN